MDKMCYTKSEKRIVKTTAFLPLALALLGLVFWLSELQAIGWDFLAQTWFMWFLMIFSLAGVVVFIGMLLPIWSPDCPAEKKELMG